MAYLFGTKRPLVRIQSLGPKIKRALVALFIFAFKGRERTAAS